MTETESVLSGNKIDRMMAKIQSLLAQADHEGTGEAEAGMLRTRAEELMRKFRIEESSLNSDDSAPSVVPVVRVVDICPVTSPLQATYLKFCYYIVRHVGAEAVIVRRYSEEAGAMMKGLELVGFESDIRYAELLITGARTYFASRMEPKVDISLPDSVNVYNLRSAGIERIRIAEKMGWGTTGSATAKVTRLYKEECDRRGEDAKLTGRGNSVANYREAFISAFPDTLWRRLYAARDASDGGSGALVLANRDDQVREAFYQRHPHLRPSDAVADRAPLTEKQLKAMAREDARAAREYEKRMARLTSPAGLLGLAAGDEAANQVDILSAGGAKRVES